MTRVWEGFGITEEFGKGLGRIGNDQGLGRVRDLPWSTAGFGAGAIQSHLLPIRGLLKWQPSLGPEL